MRERVQDSVVELIDDPYGAVGNTTSELREHVDLLMETCASLGLSFDGIVMERASEYERIRLYSLL